MGFRIALLALLLVSAGAQARLSIEISGGAEGALPIAVVPFGWQGEQAAPEDVAGIIAADLRRSGRFAPLPGSELVEQPHTAEQVNFPAWRPTGTESLVVGTLRIREGGGYVVQFQLLDTISGRQLTGYSIPTTRTGLRRTAHQISDIIYEKLTGERGAFDTRIAYVTAAQGDDGEPRYRLAIADADGFDEQVILESPQPLMSPAWSPDAARLAYVSFEQGSSAIYVQQVGTGERRRVSAERGINSAPVWSPDGRRLALTLSRDGNSEIYLLELDSGRLTRVTEDYAIDTEPAFGPDGRRLLFTSDRGGGPQLYEVTLDADGRPSARARRLTFEGGYNARGAYSPEGDSVVMVHGAGGAYRIAVQDLASGDLRVLTDTRLDESPSFAPNGRMIIYATEVAGRGVLEAVSVDGLAHQRLGLSRGDVREPAWSPYLSE